MVGDEHADALGGELGHDSLDVDHRQRVDARKWFIEEHETGLRGQRTRDFDAPAFAARQRHAETLAHVRDPQFPQYLLEPLLARGFVQVFARLENRHDIVFDCQLAENRSFLRQITDARVRALVHRKVRDVAFIDRDPAGIGYLPQEASVFRKLSVEDNVMAILETRENLDETARQERLEQILGELRIAHVRKSLGMALSGGERRRVEIARALAAEPRFVLLDEPFAGVDPLSVIDIQRIMTELTAKGIGVLITDHNVRETLGVCGRAYIVSGGTVIASGSSEEILANPQVREVYLGQSFRM